VALVRRNLLVEWNSSFNQSRSAGVPRLTIELSAPVNSPFKKAESSCSYRFFVSEDEVSAHLKSAILASSGWF
jgi:23S rRNA C2498 (ribose-2'-O)-methylase RlmM